MQMKVLELGKFLDLLCGPKGLRSGRGRTEGPHMRRAGPAAAGLAGGGMWVTPGRWER